MKSCLTDRVQLFSTGEGQTRSLYSAVDAVPSSWAEQTSAPSMLNLQGWWAVPILL